MTPEDLIARGPRYPVPSLDVDAPPRLMVVIDTEEEFDWSAPFRRDATSVEAMRVVGRLQHVFDRYRVRPTYVVAYPVASQPTGFMPLREIAARGGCQIGAHLHPWVNPPFEEPVSRETSYACNLAPDLQRRKLHVLRDTIAEAFGAPPRIFKAGRYGFGPSSVDALEQLGFDVDVSVNPEMDFSADGGPDFRGFDVAPFWFGRTPILEVPCTTACVGWLGAQAARVREVANRAPLHHLRGVGVLARLQAANRIMLSPEGHTLEEMQVLTETLFERGVRAFMFTLHSPSAAPGHTPYVRTEQDLALFLDRIDAYLDFFFGRLGGVSTDPGRFRAELAGGLVSAAVGHTT